MNRTHIFSLNGSVNGLCDICSRMGQSVKKGLDFAPHSPMRLTAEGLL